VLKLELSAKYKNITGPEGGFTPAPRSAHKLALSAKYKKITGMEEGFIPAPVQTDKPRSDWVEEVPA
jgi:hypothetical protein